MLDPQIAEQLRRAGFDVTAIQELPALLGIPDRAVLQYATGEGYSLVTDNARDFIPLHHQLMADGEHHHGILLAAASALSRSKRTIGLWVSVLKRYLTAQPDGPDLTDRIGWL